jgi:hypothetical protein
MGGRRMVYRLGRTETIGVKKALSGDGAFFAIVLHKGRTIAEMTKYQQIVWLIVFVLGSTVSFAAQTDAAPSCGQPTEVTNPLMIKAERAQYYVRRREMSGDFRMSGRKLFRTIGPVFEEGDTFNRQRLWSALKRLSWIKGIYPVTQKDLEIRLDDRTKYIDIVFCIKEKPNPWSSIP